jgi:hypothetical protein
MFTETYTLKTYMYLFFEVIYKLVLHSALWFHLPATATFLNRKKHSVFGSQIFSAMLPAKFQRDFSCDKEKLETLALKLSNKITFDTKI